MAGIQCGTILLYSTPALVFTKEKSGAARAQGAGSEEKKKKITINTEEENVLHGSKVFTQMAELLYRKKEYRKALLLLDTANELDETNKHAYLIRAIALIRLGRYREALKELDHVADPNNKSVLMLRSMASWYSGEFEQAAVSAARGNRQRAQPPFFKQMFNSKIMSSSAKFRDLSHSNNKSLNSDKNGLATKAEFPLRPKLSAIGSIDRCIGPSSGDILLESFKDILQMEEEKKRNATPNAGATHYCDQTLSNSGGRKSTVADVNRAHRCKLYKRELTLYLMQLHMGRLSVANRFLSELPEMPGFVAPNQKGVDIMNLLIKCVMTDLENRLSELMMDMPMYVYKRVALIKKSARMQACDEKRQQELKEQTKDLIKRMLVNILEVREKNMPMESLRASHRARNVIASLPKSLVPDKRLYLNIVYHLIGIALLEAKLKDPNLPDAANKNNILGWLGIKRKEVIMKNSEFPFLDYKRWLAWSMRTYSLSPSYLERTWLLYIIAVCNSGYGNYDGCRNHIRRSVNAARATGSHIWAINGLVIQAHAELKLNSKLDAKNSIKEAIELAQELKDESIISALAMMNEAIDEQSLDSDNAAEEKRFFRSLVAMMPTHGMKNEMRHILHRRAYIPRSRRLPISVRRDSPPNLGDTAEDAEKEKRPRLWPKKKRSN